MKINLIASNIEDICHVYSVDCVSKITSSPPIILYAIYEAVFDSAYPLLFWWLLGYLYFILSS